MMMRNLGLFVSTVVLLAASAAWAAHPVAPGEIEGDISDYTGQGGESPFPPFSELDRNSDGKLDSEEVSAVEPLQRQFQAADVDQNGMLDQEEFSAFEVREGVMPGLEGEQ